MEHSRSAFTLSHLLMGLVLLSVLIGQLVFAAIKVSEAIHQL